MTESTSLEKPQVEGRFTPRSLLGAVGFTIMLASMLIGVYSTVLNTELTAHPATFAFLRGIALLFMAATYFAVYEFLPNRNAIVRRKIIKFVFFILQALLPACCIMEHVTQIIFSPIVIGILWALWGIAVGYFTCSWIDGLSNVDEQLVSPVIIIAFVGASILLVFVSSSYQPLGAISYLAIVAISFAILLEARNDIPTEPTSMDSPNEKWLKERAHFKKEGSYIMFVDGLLIANVAAFLLAKITRLDLSPALVGLSFIGTMLLFELLRRKVPHLLSLRESQLFFLPFIVCGLTLMTFTVGIPQIAVAFVLMLILFAFEISNTSSLAIRSNALAVSPCICFAKGRIFVVLGQSVGWFIGSFLASSTVRYLPVLFVVFVFLVCLYVSIVALKAADLSSLAEDQAIEEPGLASISEQASPEKTLKDKCAHVAMAYDLTPREGEILLFLARGRNAKYIADKFFVSERTVKTHIYHIYQKMDLHSQQDLINIVDEERMPER